MNGMNVLIYISDQHRWDCMGCSGNQFIQTPNMDKFAEEGIRFHHMYSHYPLCGPARACLVTGQYPQANGARFNGPGVHPYCPKLPAILKENGYRTGMVGIVDLEPRDGKYHGYDTYLYRNEYKKWAEERGAAELFGWQKSVEKYKKAGHHYYGALDYYQEDHFSSWVAERSIRLMEEWREQPFFMWVGDRMPHPPYLSPRPYDTMYDGCNIPIHPAIDPEQEEIGNIREAMAHYYGLISLVDHNFGRVLDSLKNLGIYDNTIVIYCSDHGNMIGHHGLYGKMSLYDDDVRVPFILRYPGQPAKKQVVEEFAGQIDVLPTILDLLGIEIPRAVQGKSLVPVIEGSQPGQDSVFAFQSSEWEDKRQMIRTRDWKLIHRLSGGMLFDLKNNPFETKNLYGSPEYRDVEAALKEKLLAWHLETVDGTLPSLFDFHGQGGSQWIRRWLDPLC